MKNQHLSCENNCELTIKNFKFMKKHNVHKKQQI